MVNNPDEWAFAEALESGSFIEERMRHCCDQRKVTYDWNWNHAWLKPEFEHLHKAILKRIRIEPYAVFFGTIPKYVTPTFLLRMARIAPCTMDKLLPLIRCPEQAEAVVERLTICPNVWDQTTVSLDNHFPALVPILRKFGAPKFINENSALLILANTPEATPLLKAAFHPDRQRNLTTALCYRGCFPQAYILDPDKTQLVSTHLFEDDLRKPGLRLRALSYAFSKGWLTTVQASEALKLIPRCDKPRIVTWRSKLELQLARNQPDKLVAQPMSIGDLELV